MKDVSVTDLVPVKVLYDIAKRIRAQAVANARALGLPPRVHDNKEEGISGRSIGIPPARVTAKQISVDLTLNGVGLAYEFGSGLHKTKKAGGASGKYPITAKNSPNLVFQGTNKWKDQLIITDVVMHPGVAPRPFLEPAKRSTRAQNLEDIRRHVNGSIRLIVKGMARKV